MSGYRCRVCGNHYKAKKNGEPSVYMAKHFMKDKKHLTAIIPYGLVFETRGELLYWIKLRLGVVDI